MMEGDGSEASGQCFTIMSLEVAKVVIESDSLEVIQFINAPLDVSDQIMDLAQYICHLKEDHGLMQFQYVHCETNKLADYLALVATWFPFV